MATSQVSFFSNLIWLIKEFFKFFHSPIGVMGGLLDAVRGWKFSRSWLSIWLNLPLAVALASVYVVFGISQYTSKEGQIQRFLAESESRCSTVSLETVCNELRKKDFYKSLEIDTSEADNPSTITISELAKKYAELLSKRIIEIEAGNQSARYRLGMIHFLNGEREAADNEMLKLAEGKYGMCPQANAWIAKKMVSSATMHNENIVNALTPHLEKAMSWKNVDYRLILLYSVLAEQKGDLEKAILLAKKAVAVQPDSNVQLARLYERAGREESLRECAYSIEEHFGKRLKTPSEKDSDRLAVAEARKLTGRLDEAAAVLSEGLVINEARPKLRRALSEIELLQYSKSVSREPGGRFTADLALLEKAAQTDPNNPNISLEIAKLQPMRIDPTKNLKDVLKNQIRQGITNVAAYTVLAEAFYRSGYMKDAIQFWEFALRKEPKNVVVMNNLALVLAKSNPENLTRSIDLLNLANSLSPADPEILDSLGQVLMQAKRYKEAINKFEAAIGLDKTRVSTREKVIEAYKAIGMEDMAKAQQKFLNKGKEPEKPKGSGQTNSKVK